MSSTMGISRDAREDGLRIAVVVKQVPRIESLVLDASGRLQRNDVPLEMNAYCRRAVAKGVELAHATNGRCTVATLGPPSADEVLREALAWGADAGVLLTDPRFAGSDTLATARALAALLEREGPYDLVLVGRSSIDAETGQVGPELAQLLGLPFASAVRDLELDQSSSTVRVLCEEDDGGCDKVIQLPAVLAVAERLCDPAKVPADDRPRGPLPNLKWLDASDLASTGPWGNGESPTRVGALQIVRSDRTGALCRGSLDEQVATAIDLLIHRGALDSVATSGLLPVPLPYLPMDSSRGEPKIGVVLEKDRGQLTRELLGAAANLAAAGGARVVAFVSEPFRADEMWRWGADEVVDLKGVGVEEDVAHAIFQWCDQYSPDIVLAPGTTWGREVASRIAVQLGAGLIGDALELDLVGGRLRCLKPACGGSLVAEITTTSQTQMATVRPGVLPVPEPRVGSHESKVSVINMTIRGRVDVTGRWRDDDLDALNRAEAVVGVGMGVAPEHYDEIHQLVTVLGGEIAATRRVTDRGWLPHSRQLGITGRSISPRLYVAIGMSGKLNHLIGLRSAGTILAINSDVNALVFQGSDIGIVSDWREVVPKLTTALVTRLSPSISPP